jgi:hypothetical protein
MDDDHKRKARMLTSDETYPMRFAVDLTLLRGVVDDPNGGQEKYDYLVDFLIPSVLLHAEKTYEVFDYLAVDVTNFETCGPMEIKHLAGPYQAHMLIIFGYETKDDTSIAYSSPCIVKRSDNRPAVGYMVLNLK